MSTEMARLAQSDNKLMIDLTTKSREDAQTLKTITILTMIYLPAAFVSVSGPAIPSFSATMLMGEVKWVSSF